MYTSIRAELQKARRRHDLIVCLLVPVMGAALVPVRCADRC